MAPVEGDGVELGEVVGDLARAVGRSLDAGAILERAMAVLDPVIGQSSASVWLERDGALEQVAERIAPGAASRDGEADGREVVVVLEGSDRALGRLMVIPADGRALSARDRGLVEVAGTQIAGALERARLFKEVMELERLKSDFVARVSHELRTPITIINGFLETLLAHGDALPHDQRDHMLRRSQTASSRLARLIEELLILSRIDAGVLSPSIADVDVDILLRQVRDGALEPEQVFLDSGTGGRISTDADLLGRALGLLVDNAIKYGGLAQVLARHDGSGWTFEVRDHGSGFPRDVRSTAFEMFTRSSDTASIPGLGVGLPIARTLVEVLDGTVQLDSPRDGDGGAVVRVVLPPG